MSLSIVILAAGAGSRMNSALPKVLHLLAGVPLLEHVVKTAKSLKPDGIYIVYGHGGAEVRTQMAHLDVNWIEQTQQLGTGHAVMQAIPLIEPNDQVLVLYGDVPLISLETLNSLLEATPHGGVGIIGADFADPTGLGRIVRDASGNIAGIVEHRDCNEKQLQIHEVYTGIMTAPAACLKEWLPKLKNQNAQNEFYLTDVIKLAVNSKRPVIAVLAQRSREVEGVNDRFQLAELERYYQLMMAEKVMLAGASLKDPARFDVRGHLEVGSDVVIDVNVIIEGDVSIGKNSYIGPNVLLRNTRIGENVYVDANTVIEEAIIENHCHVGPFARIRPGTQLAPYAKIGNFVEIKNAVVGEGSKINHLSYVGDADIGKEVNIGAGTITCNYDGAKKHRTIIEDQAFIGSDTQLVAPVRVGEGATVGAGTTLRKDAPAHTLTVNTVKQKSYDNWQRPQKHAELTEQEN